MARISSSADGAKQVGHGNDDDDGGTGGAEVGAGARLLAGPGEV